jgi:hypothetical protein
MRPLNATTQAAARAPPEGPDGDGARHTSTVRPTAAATKAPSGE